MKKEIVAVTDRALCGGDFLQQLQRLAASGVSAIILRETDLSEAQYLQLARQCQKRLAHRTPLVINRQLSAARALQCRQIQLPFSQFADCHSTLADFEQVWVSVHSAAEALQAERLGAHRLIAGHIFATDCKKDLAPRGLAFLQQICQAVSVPVYAIGGVNAQTYPLLLQSEAAGVCVRSQSMTQGPFFWQ